MSETPSARAQCIALWQDQILPCQQCVDRPANPEYRKAFLRGSPMATILFVGANPGITELQTGKAFTGRSGQWLDRAIAAAGIDPDTVAFSNVVFCGSRDTSVLRPYHLVNCFAFAQRVIALINPKIVVSLGKHALTGLLGRDHLYTMVGRRFLGPQQRIYYVLQHPAYWLYKGGSVPDEYVDTLRTIREEAHNHGGNLSRDSQLAAV